MTPTCWGVILPEVLQEVLVKLLDPFDVDVVIVVVPQLMYFATKQSFISMEIVAPEELKKRISFGESVMNIVISSPSQSVDNHWFILCDSGVTLEPPPPTLTSTVSLTQDVIANSIHPTTQTINLFVICFILLPICMILRILISYLSLQEVFHHHFCSTIV